MGRINRVIAAIALSVGIAHAQPDLFPDEGTGIQNVCDAQDVACTNLANGDLLIYSTIAGNWRNIVISGSCTIDEDGVMSCTAVGLSHATDCTALACDASNADKFCWEEDDNALYWCEDDGTPAWIDLGINGAIDWTRLQNYPSACPSGMAISTLGDTVTCTAPVISHATDCPANYTCDASAANRICWDRDDNKTWVCEDDGTPEWTAMSGAGGTGDIESVFNCTSGACTELTPGATDSLDFSNVDPLQVGAGLQLPSAIDCTGAASATSVCWATAGDMLCIYDTGAWKCQVWGVSDTNTQCDESGVCSSIILDTTTCMDVDGDRLFGDNDCDAVLDATETYLDATCEETQDCEPQGTPAIFSGLTVSDCDPTLASCMWEQTCNTTALTELWMDVCSGGSEPYTACNVNADCAGGGTCVNSNMGRFGLTCDGRIETLLSDGTRKLTAWTDELGAVSYCNPGESIIGSSCQDDATQVELDAAVAALQPAPIAAERLWGNPTAEEAAGQAIELMPGSYLYFWVGQYLGFDEAAMLADYEICTSCTDCGPNTLSIPSWGTELPATCTKDQTHIKDDAPSGQRFYICESTDTWVLQGDGTGALSDNSVTEAKLNSADTPVGGQCVKIKSDDITAFEYDTCGVGSTALDDVTDPDADKSFSMGTNKLTWSYTTPDDLTGAFGVEATGAFTNSLFKISQSSTSNVGANLLHLEAADGDVIPLRIVETHGDGAGIPIVLDFLSASPANEDDIAMEFYMNDSASGRTQAGAWLFSWSDYTAGSEDSYHRVYVAVNGSIAEALNVRGSTLTIPGAFVSEIVTGTAPLTVASTTKVANLNADLWDGVSLGTQTNGKACILDTVAAPDEIDCDTTLFTAADVPAAETDSAHDTCAEISGCVVGALTAEVDGSITNEIEVVDEAYSSANFNGGTASAVSQDDFYDYNVIADTDDDGLPNKVDLGECSDDGDKLETDLNGVVSCGVVADSSTTNEIEVVDEAYSSANFNGGTTSAVSQDDFYDYSVIADTDDDGLPNKVDIGQCDSDTQKIETDASGVLSCGALPADDDVPEVGDLDAFVGGRSTTYDTTNNQLDADLETYRDTKCMTIETPAATDWLTMFRAESALTITGIDCIAMDGTSVLVDVEECSGNNAGTVDAQVEATITCDADGGAEATSIDNPNIEAGDWIRLDLGTNTGTVTQLSVCVTFTYDD